MCIRDRDSNDALKKCFKYSLGEEAEELKTVTRGLDTLRSASRERNDGLHHFMYNDKPVFTHVKWRQIYINKGDIESCKRQSTYNTSPTKKKLRTSTDNDAQPSSSTDKILTFDWEHLCFFCKEQADDAVTPLSFYVFL